MKKRERKKEELRKRGEETKGGDKEPEKHETHGHT